MHHLKWTKRALTIAIILALSVVLLGAYTRLTNAGLGCPDWPGCYGRLVIPQSVTELNRLQDVYPAVLLEVPKAWTEMIHRYAAGSLLILILLIASQLLWKKENRNSVLTILLLIACQAALGMWTVTLKLLPIVVMGHLLGGILIFACLCRLRLHISTALPLELPLWRLAITGGVIIVFCQIALGGWVSANYAGLACLGFPQCNGQWLPKLHLNEGFNLFSPLGINYQGGNLESNVRVTIQFIHRLGALLTILYLSILSLGIFFKVCYKPLKWLAAFAFVLVVTQFSLGILNVRYFLPLPVALAHNGVAALLFATMLSLLYLTKGQQHGTS